MSKAIIESLISQIENETAASGNTKQRVAALFRKLNLEKFDNESSFNKNEILNLINQVKALAVSKTQFIGSINPSTAIPDGDIWAFATPGSYPDGIIVGPNQLSILTRVADLWDLVAIDIPLKSIDDIEESSTNDFTDTVTFTFTDGSTPLAFEIPNIDNLSLAKHGGNPSPEIAINPVFIADGYYDEFGVFVPYAQTKVTDFIDIPDGKETVNIDRSDQISLSFWTQDEQFISIAGTQSTTYNAVFQKPANAKKLIYCRSITNIGAAYLKFPGVSGNGLFYYKFSNVVSNENKLAGSIIYWFGTSIPAGYPHDDLPDIWAYPNIIGNRNKAKVFNYCVPNGLIRSANSNGTGMGSGSNGNNADGRNILSFTRKDEFGNFTSVINWYDSLISKFGTVDEPTKIVLEYTVNDYDQDPTDIDQFATFDMTSEDTTTFIGAYNFVLKKIFELRPNMKVYLITHFSDDSAAGSASYASVNRAIEKLGAYWGLPTLKLWSKTGFVKRNGLDLITANMPDKIHLASAPTPATVNKTADIVEAFLLNN